MLAVRMLLLCLAAIPPASFAAAPASACLIYSPTCVGDREACNPTPAQRRAQEKLASEEETRRRLIDARARMARGEADPAAELAELLVPNIRPVWLEHSSCGPEGEVDYGKGRVTEQTDYENLVSGTPLEGSEIGEFARIVRSELYSLGPECNTEFRRTFATFLRSSLSGANLEQAWLFLGARHRPHGAFLPRFRRLVSFKGDSRAPPIRWMFENEWLEKQVAAALRRTAWGRSLSAATDAFWTRHSSGLQENQRACPEAAADWEELRRQLIPQMLAQREERLRQRSARQ